MQPINIKTKLFFISINFWFTNRLHLHQTITSIYKIQKLRNEIKLYLREFHIHDIFFDKTE